MQTTGPASRGSRTQMKLVLPSLRRRITFRPRFPDPMDGCVGGKEPVSTAAEAAARQMSLARHDADV
jgi:hypothetical protein